jgi:hypothetical protein
LLAAVARSDDDDAVLVGGIVGGICALILILSILFLCCYLQRNTDKKEKTYRTFEMVVQDTEIEPDLTVSSSTIDIDTVPETVALNNDDAPMNMNAPVFVPPVPPPVKLLTAKEKVFVCDEP